MIRTIESVFKYAGVVMTDGNIDYFRGLSQAVTMSEI